MFIANCCINMLVLLPTLHLHPWKCHS